MNGTRVLRVGVLHLAGQDEARLREDLASIKECIYKQLSGEMSDGVGFVAAVCADWSDDS